jgi:hypothetical protein
MKFNILLLFVLISTMPSFAQEKKANNLTTREVWLTYMDKTARPVIENLANNMLKKNMTIELSGKIDNPESRKRVAYLEVFARTLSGISPWMNIEGGTPNEVALREKYRQWSVKALANAVNPESPDYMVFSGGQPLVDASFLALALVRCPWLWENLDAEAKKNLETALVATRQTIPVYSNWILFSGMIEAFFAKYGLNYDPVRIEYGIRQLSGPWYAGDGMFNDGNDFHMDYYNSYVIQPYLTNILDATAVRTKSFGWFAPKMDQIAQRYAVIQERMINTDGTFPVVGRSIVYRGGAFHHLADMALREKLPASLKPAQVRGALTAVIDKTLGAPNTFTDAGWLTIGLHGKQPQLADFYINTGSLYICATIFLPLGLPESNDFWAAPNEPWTSVKVWSGGDLPGDHALKIKQ